MTTRLRVERIILLDGWVGFFIDTSLRKPKSIVARIIR
jgi:hypothetical protein